MAKGAAGTINLAPGDKFRFGVENLSAVSAWVSPRLKADYSPYSRGAGRYVCTGLPQRQDFWIDRSLTHSAQASVSS